MILTDQLDDRRERENIKMTQETTKKLQEELRKLNEKIGNYPSPITGCDEHFNYHLEMRSKMERRIREPYKRSDIKMWGGGNLY